MIFAGHSYFNFHDPEAFDYDIQWIAHSLSHLNRFNGYTIYPYSVAQHSVYCSLMVDQTDSIAMRAALLHDAAEAFVGDVTKPLKNLCPDYAAIEDRVQRAIYRHYNLPEQMPAAVKEADLRMLATEARQITFMHSDRLKDFIESYSLRIEQWSVEKAHRMFIDRFHTLGIFNDR